MRFAFYVSGHGFGHAVRDAELIATLGRARRDLEFVVRTTARPSLFPTLDGRLRVDQVEVDTGLIQADSLRSDSAASARAAARFYRDFDRRTAEEAAYLRAQGIDLVLADIPALAIAAAAEAGVPSVAIGNFTWDWIYQADPAFSDLAPEVVPIIERAYARVTCALRLPFHGGFQAMARQTIDIPCIARRSSLGRGAARVRLSIEPDATVILPSFGGHGLALPPEDDADRGRYVRLPDEPPAGLLYPDLVAAADVVISKPGYGVVTDCLASDTALLYTSRGQFAEYDVFVREMPHVLRCRFIPPDDLLAGRWAPHLDALLAQAAPPRRMALNGAEVATAEILRLCEGR